jgi:hypothetical protein
MGIYVYQVTKGKKAVIDGKMVEVGVLKYFCKPYWDVWDIVLNGYSARFFGEQEKLISKKYRMFFARQEKIPYRKYVVVEFKKDEYVYEMEEGKTWTYDDPHFGIGIIGKLDYISGYWDYLSGYWYIDRTSIP